MGPLELVVPLELCRRSKAMVDSLNRSPTFEGPFVYLCARGCIAILSPRAPKTRLQTRFRRGANRRPSVLS